MSSTKEDNSKLEIPSDLIEAIEMSSFERQLPRQGCTAIHKFLMDPNNEDAEDQANKWIENQKTLWPEVDRVVYRLQMIGVSAKDDLAPWLREAWWMQLNLPWSDNLGAAIELADVWCDLRDDQSA
jgi:hypothetical protein